MQQCRVARAVSAKVPSEDESTSSHCAIGGVLLKYVASLHQREDHASIPPSRVFFPFILSPLRLVLSLTSASLLGQAAQLLYALLGFPAAMYSASLARRQLDAHISSGRLPVVFTHLEESTMDAAVEVALPADMGWGRHATLCELCQAIALSEKLC